MKKGLNNMAMKPVEMIEFYENEYKLTEETFIAAKEQNSTYLYNFGYKLKMESKLMQCLISWRLGLSDTKNYVFQIYEDTIEAVNELVKIQS